MLQYKVSLVYNVSKAVCWWTVCNTVSIDQRVEVADLRLHCSATVESKPSLKYTFYISLLFTRYQVYSLIYLHVGSGLPLAC